MVVASITIALDALPGSRDVLITNGPEQSTPGGPITVLATPAGQITLAPQDVLLTPALQSSTCIIREGVKEKSVPIKGNTGQITLTAKVRNQNGTPAVSAPVTFTVTGPNATQATKMTVQGGRAIFSYTGMKAGVDTVVATVTLGGSNISSNVAYVQWSKVTVAFNMPLPESSSPRWRVTTRVNDPGDGYHQCNGYYSLDLADSVPGSHAPVLVGLGGTVTSEFSNSTVQESCDPVPLGTSRVVDHQNDFSTIYGHLKADTVQVQPPGGVDQGQVMALMDTTGCAFGVHLHFQIRYHGTSAQNDYLRILVEGRAIQDYCVKGQPDLNNVKCMEDKYISSNNGLPFGFIDAPVANTIVRSTLTVSGWAFDDGSIGNNSILIDGGAVGSAAFTTLRPDVCSVYDWSGFTNCSASQIGFVGTVDTTKLSNGPHKLGVTMTDDHGAERLIGEVPIQVANP